MWIVEVCLKGYSRTHTPQHSFLPTQHNQVIGCFCKIKSCSQPPPGKLSLVVFQNIVVYIFSCTHFVFNIPILYTCVGGNRTATCLTHIFKTILLTNIHQRNTLRNFGCVHANELVSSSYTVKKDVLMGMWVSISWLPSARQHPVLVGIPIIPPPPPPPSDSHHGLCSLLSQTTKRVWLSPSPPSH